MIDYRNYVILKSSFSSSSAIDAYRVYKIYNKHFLRLSISFFRFNSTITGQFYGHTHFDQFNMFYSEDRSTPVGVAFIAPSATSYTYVSLAFGGTTY